MPEPYPSLPTECGFGSPYQAAVVAIAADIDYIGKPVSRFNTPWTPGRRFGGHTPIAATINTPLFSRVFRRGAVAATALPAPVEAAPFRTLAVSILREPSLSAVRRNSEPVLRYAWNIASQNSDMTLLDAQPFDAARARRRRIFIASAIVALLLLAGIAWMYRNWPEERVISNFFAALQKQDYESAYAIYFNDPAWRQHQQKYSQYPYADFYRDWGPGGEWGLVKSFRIYGTANTEGFMSGGVIVEVIVNERAEHARMFVERSDKTITVYPY